MNNINKNTTRKGKWPFDKIFTEGNAYLMAFESVVFCMFEHISPCGTLEAKKRKRNRQALTCNEHQLASLLLYTENMGYVSLIEHV